MAVVVASTVAEVNGRNNFLDVFSTVLSTMEKTIYFSLFLDWNVGDRVIVKGRGRYHGTVSFTVCKRIVFQQVA